MLCALFSCGISIMVRWIWSSVFEYLHSQSQDIIAALSCARRAKRQQAASPPRKRLGLTVKNATAESRDYGVARKENFAKTDGISHLRRLPQGGGNQVRFSSLVVTTRVVRDMPTAAVSARSALRFVWDMLTSISGNLRSTMSNSMIAGSSEGLIEPEKIEFEQQSDSEVLEQPVRASANQGPGRDTTLVASRAESSALENSGFKREDRPFQEEGWTSMSRVSLPNLGQSEDGWHLQGTGFLEQTSRSTRRRSDSDGEPRSSRPILLYSRTKDWSESARSRKQLDFSSDDGQNSTDDTVPSDVDDGGLVAISNRVTAQCRSDAEDTEDAEKQGDDCGNVTFPHSRVGGRDEVNSTSPSFGGERTSEVPGSSSSSHESSGEKWVAGRRSLWKKKLLQTPLMMELERAERKQAGFKGAGAGAVVVPEDLLRGEEVVWRNGGSAAGSRREQRSADVSTVILTEPLKSPGVCFRNEEEAAARLHVLSSIYKEEPKPASLPLPVKEEEVSLKLCDGDDFFQPARSGTGIANFGGCLAKEWDVRGSQTRHLEDVDRRKFKFTRDASHELGQEPRKKKRLKSDTRENCVKIASIRDGARSPRRTADDCDAEDAKEGMRGGSVTRQPLMTMHEIFSHRMLQEAASRNRMRSSAISRQRTPSRHGSFAPTTGRSKLLDRSTPSGSTSAREMSRPSGGADLSEKKGVSISRNFTAKRVLLCNSIGDGSGANLTPVGHAITTAATTPRDPLEFYHLNTSEQSTADRREDEEVEEALLTARSFVLGENGHLLTAPWHQNLPNQWERRNFTTSSMSLQTGLTTPGSACTRRRPHTEPAGHEESVWIDCEEGSSSWKPQNSGGDWKQGVEADESLVTLKGPLGHHRRAAVYRAGVPPEVQLSNAQQRQAYPGGFSHSGDQSSQLVLGDLVSDLDEVLVCLLSRFDAMAEEVRGKLTLFGLELSQLSRNVEELYKIKTLLAQVVAGLPVHSD